MKNLTILLTLVISILNTNIYGQENQHQLLKSVESGSFSIFKSVGPSYKKKWETVKKPWPVIIEKKEGNIQSVLVKRAGILDEKFVPDIAAMPAYFKFNVKRLTYLDGKIYYYKWIGKTSSAEIEYVLVKQGESFKGKWEEENAKLATYVKQVIAKQGDAREEIALNKEANAEKERRANSLQDKDPIKLEVKLINNPTKIAHFSEPIKYGVIAILKDGTKLKTENLGGKIPWSDFSVKCEGATSTLEEVSVLEDAAKIPNDRILITVFSKYHSSLKASKSINATFNQDIHINYGGYHGWDASNHRTVFQGRDGQWAGNGKNIVVKVQAVKHKQTGETIYKIDVTNATDGTNIGRFKVSKFSKITINAMGGNGENGRKGRSGDSAGGKGGNGGNGGNVSITLDSGSAGLNLEVNNQGGKGGNGGPPYSVTGYKGSNGTPGSSGSTNRRTGSVSINW